MNRQKNLCYIIRGEKSNIENFLSHIPTQLAQRWELFKNTSTPAWHYLSLVEDENPFYAVVRYVQSDDEYDIFILPASSSPNNSYSVDVCMSLVKMFICDFLEWAKINNITFVEIYK